MKIPFHKLHGCGNDFIFIDNARAVIPQAFYSAYAHTLCDRTRGVGADGIAFLVPLGDESECAYQWHFYNRDGSRGEMCGNAARCVAWLTNQWGWAGAEHSFLTDAGPVDAQVDASAMQARIRMPSPESVELDRTVTLFDGDYRVHTARVGVPHLAMFVEDTALVDIDRLGNGFLTHPLFQPARINSNFLSTAGESAFHIRTFERGVDAETNACGTGCTASAAIAHRLEMAGPDVEFITRQGDRLSVSLKDGKAYLSGSAAYCFSGEFDPVHFGLQR